MAGIMKQILAKSITLTEEVIKSAKRAIAFKKECYDIKSQTVKLAKLLRQMVDQAQAASGFYKRPVGLIVNKTEKVLERALSLVLKCCNIGLMKRVLFIIPANEFKSVSNQLQSSVGDVSWLQRILFAGDDLTSIHFSLPPIAFNDPILAWTWECISALYNGSIVERCEATTELLSLSLDSDEIKKLIIEEGGVVPLLKSLKKGMTEEQITAAKAIGKLGFDSESVEHIIDAGVCSVFAKILKEGSIKVQTEVAWAVSNLVSNHPKCQDIFSQHNIVRLLINHLAFEVVQEHFENAIVINKATSVLTIVMAKNYLNTREAIEANNNDQPNHSYTTHEQNLSLSSTSFKGRDNEDPETKSQMKALAARALMELVKGNPSISRNIVESRALMCFVALLDHGKKNVRNNSAMALMEITAVAEHDTDLRRFAFKHSSPACKAIVAKLLKIIDEVEDSNLVIPCIKSIGNLARTFRVTETRIIAPLVQLLDEKEDEVLKEALISLTRFACTDNYLHIDHCKTIISAGAAKHLVQLVYFEEKRVKLSALLLLCYIALYVPASEELIEAKVLIVMEWASNKAYVFQNETLYSLLQEAKSRLELYQSTG